ncbi:hypothetical protein LOTGIDRAFT_178346 [Lottia gigantea]|uniref:Uncharacterized protein n=1 Tax=Lottia gigantea TaxID=225164 RepID=V3ZV84_LOTGI|nr:hypothetical protein LOTGIDRAFT_178346 [Lottia gigantea]ESO95393.1 hypothetical protein LOTGIDRAFT_178346 [Lottia gigantea]
MSAGWGRKAATRIDRTQFNNDELLKSLGSQFNVDFNNYDQWSRTSKSNAHDKSQCAKPSPPTEDDSTSFTVKRLKLKKQATEQENKEKELAQRIDILKVRIKSREKSCSDYQKRSKKYLDENRSRWGESVLRRYEKYRVGMATINSNFAKELDEALEDLQIAKLKVDSHLSALEKEGKILNEQLTEKQNELSVLVSYKDKEYPVKAMKIAGLNTEIENLKLTNDEDCAELEHIVNTELGKYEKNQTKVTNEVTRNVTEKAVKMMHPSLKDMALQNMVMLKEMEFHKQEQEELEEKSAKLQEEVQKLLKDKKSNVQYQMFPEFYPRKAKCTPDMDIVLDIDTQEFLPI